MFGCFAPELKGWRLKKQSPRIQVADGGIPRSPRRTPFVYKNDHVNLKIKNIPK